MRRRGGTVNSALQLLM